MNDQKGFFDLDKYALDDEWVNQPKIFHDQATKQADARRVWEEFKAEKDVVEAELDKAIRLDPGRFGVVKVTEGVVEKTITLQDSYQEIVGKVIQAKHQLDIITAVVDAMEHRKKALENLVYLQGQSYFSEPVVKDRATREEMEERQKKQARNKTKLERKQK